MSESTASSMVLSTLNTDGSRRWIRPRPAVGRWLTRRKAVGYGLIALFVLLPHLRIRGKPPLLLDVVHREFTFFGTTLYPTDTLILALSLVLVFVSVFFLTALFGRLWCGWACPQTVYMELIFRPIERFFDGTPGKNSKRKSCAWMKYVVYVLLAVALAHTFLSYFVPTDELRVWVTRSPLEHPISFLVMVGVTGLMLFDFVYFREQMCLIACPYGRFQSVMLDRDSMIIGYDVDRGEPRGRLRKPNAASTDVALPLATQGDCIDCRMCVTCCPTGIDIRNGLQMECVNCTQCIDACDRVMDKIGKPRGLIRYASQRTLEGQSRRLMRVRPILYIGIMTALCVALGTLVATRSDALVRVIRDRGIPFGVLDDGTVTNGAQVKIRNRTQHAETYTVNVIAPEQAYIMAPMELEAGPGELVSGKIMLGAPKSLFDGGTDVTIRVVGTSGVTDDVVFRMLGPMTRLPE